MTDRILFYCQHVLGIGHLVRSAAIVRALSSDSQVLFVSGGERPEGFRFPEHKNVTVLQLPPLKTSPDFSHLQVCHSSRSLDETKTLRTAMLLDAFAEFDPHAIVTELFPFGRKQFRFELLPLLERAWMRSRRPLMASSVRDILVARKDQEEYERTVCDLVNRFYDLVLVHGDDTFLKLDQTFSRTNDLRCHVVYTGYVRQHGQHSAANAGRSATDGHRQPVITVSIGSGQYLTGQMLLENVMRAAKLVQSRIPHEFQVFAGPLMPEETYRRLQSLASESTNVKFSRYTPDLAAMLRNSEVSVSMAGYNTVMDVLSSGVRALVYPVTSNGDQEQIVRAEGLEKAGVVDVIRTEQLAPDQLARKLEMAVSKPPTSLTLNCGGAVNTAGLLKKHLAAKRKLSIDASETRCWSHGNCDTERQSVSSLKTENAG